MPRKLPMGLGQPTLAPQPPQGGSGRNRFSKKWLLGSEVLGHPHPPPQSPQAYLEIMRFLGGRRYCSGSPGGRQHREGQSRPGRGARVLQPQASALTLLPQWSVYHIPTTCQVLGSDPFLLPLSSHSSREGCSPNTYMRYSQIQAIQWADVRDSCWGCCR